MKLGRKPDFEFRIREPTIILTGKAKKLTMCQTPHGWRGAGGETIGPTAAKILDHPPEGIVWPITLLINSFPEMRVQVCVAQEIRPADAPLGNARLRAQDT